MARKCNGTSDKLTLTLDLSAFSLVSVAGWLWMDNLGSAERMGISSSTSVGTISSFYFEPRSSHGAVCEISLTRNSSQFWSDSFPQPSAAAWHHYLLVCNRATPLNKAYVDGAPQTLATILHNAGAWGNFAAGTMTMLGYNTSLFTPGRLAEVAIWGGVEITAGEAKALAIGASPETVHPDGIVFHTPLFGTDSPEPDYSGKQHSVALTGTSWAAHPGIAPGFWLPKRGFQPVPV